MLAALVVGMVEGGTSSLRQLLARLFRWRVAARWYAVTLAPAAAALLALGAMAAVGRGWPTWDALGTMPGAPGLGWLGVLAVVLVVNGYGEEVGWRGFAWPRLRERYTLGSAAALLAVPWAIWHIPTFWLETGMADFDLFVISGWLIGLASGAVVLGWLYERTGSSLLVVALFHAFLNMGSATAATEGLPTAAVSAAVIAWAVALLLRHAPRAHRARWNGRNGRGDVRCA
jgi:membrane protease YdiL (CAAX protease family)